MIQKKAIVVGSGILGMAAAKSLSELNYQVTVFERSLKAEGSSIRNFGMVWPIGQHSNKYLERALQSRDTWTNICKNAGIWHHSSGSLQLFTNKIELEMANEFYDAEIHHRSNLKILTAEKCLEMAPNLNQKNVIGGLFSSTEVIVESREAIRVIPTYLAAKYNIEFNFGKTIVESTTGKVKTSDGETYLADIIVICSGYETNLLYPSIFETAPITISQLNMLRSAPIAHQIPAICAGLSYLHYDSYSTLSQKNEYQNFCLEKYPNQVKNGIHLLVSQNHELALTIGDSHEYGNQLDPLQSQDIDQFILDYYAEIMNKNDIQIAQRGMGKYLKMTNGESEWIQEVENGVFIFNGPGGAGMTLGWGMAHEIIPKIA